MYGFGIVARKRVEPLCIEFGVRIVEVVRIEKDESLHTLERRMEDLHHQVLGDRETIVIPDRSTRQ